MNEKTARLALPLLVPGQAQKDMTHNEALALLAIATQASVVAAGTNMPPSDPAPGACWIVGNAPTGAWSDHAKCVAGWTIGGWRFVPPHVGFTAHVETTGRQAVFEEGEWRIGLPTSAIDAPSGGDIIDTQARTTIGHILTALRRLDLVPGIM